MTSYGVDLFADHRLYNNRTDNERALAATAWLCWTVGVVWTVAPSQTADGEHLIGQGQRRFVVRSHRLGKGLEVAGEGDTIPWHVLRGSAWTCAGQTLPSASDQPLSPWISDAVGASWKAVR